MIQKKINLDEILSDIKNFETKQDALKSFYVPFDFCLSIRTIYNNLVLKFFDDKYYIHLKNLFIKDIPLSCFRSDELIAYFSKEAIMGIINYSRNFDLLIRDTMLQTIGLYNPKYLQFNPILYVHLILRDEVVSEFKKYLKPNINFVSIQFIGNDCVFKDSFVIV